MLNINTSLESKPAISVCIATFNGGKYIKEQLYSIINQLNSSDEIVISDDSSTDDTIDVIESFADDRIKVFADQKFGSAVLNFENAIKNASGHIIIMADQDDVWLPGRVNQIVLALHTNDCVITNGYMVNENLEKTGATIFNVVKTRTSVIRNIIKNSWVGCCMAFNTKVKDKVLPFRPGIPMHDQWIGIIASLYFKVAMLSEPSILFRRHGANSSNTGQKSKNSLWQQLMLRYHLVSNLLIFLLSNKTYGGVSNR